VEEKSCDWCNHRKPVFLGLKIGNEMSNENSSCIKSGNEISIFIAGDAIITQPWSHLDGSAFLHLVKEIRGAEVAIVNLETLIHDFKGYPQANIGGTYMASNPKIADELAWAGFDVALVSATSTYVDHGRAGRSRPDLHGRPGINPLSLDQTGDIHITRLITITFKTPTRVNQNDLKRNLDAIREAKSNADFVVMSLHAHSQGSWLVKFAHQAIDAGVDVFFAHGPHVIRGVEIYRCKPIFYSLGNFVFQNEQVELFPAEMYESEGLGDNASPEDVINARYNFSTRGFPVRRAVWEGIAATVHFKQGKVIKVRLIPVDMGFGQPIPYRGRPKFASKELGEKIIGDVIEESRRYKTEIGYVESENIGVVKIK
jgi:poly-gamma-glutamate synthesis protein (capsule biosynthesis protein)